MRLHTLILMMRAQVVTLFAVLLALIVTALPTTAYAIDATAAVYKDNLNGTFTLSASHNFGSDPSSLSLSSPVPGPLCPTGPTADVCVQIDPSSRVTFTAGSASQSFGELDLAGALVSPGPPPVFLPFSATNMGTGPVLLVINYGHTITSPAVDGTQVQCAGMSLNGFNGPVNDSADFVDLSMTVTWQNCPGCPIAFTIGAQNLPPCPTVPGAQSSPSTLLANASVTVDPSWPSYQPATPVQVINLISNACNGTSCTPSARIDKKFETRLGPTDSTNTTSSALGFIGVCGSEKGAFKTKPPVCDNPNAGAYTTALLEAQILWVVPHDTVTGTKAGNILSETFDNLGVKSTDIDYVVGGKPFLSVPGFPGAPLLSVLCKPGECALKHEEALVTGLTCSTKTLLLTGTAFNGTISFVVGAPVTVTC